MSNDLAYVCDNVPPSHSRGINCGFSPVAEKRMVVSVMRKYGIVRNERCSHQDLIEFFKHQLKVKSRTDRKRMILADSIESRVHIANLVHVNGIKHDYLFLVSSRHNGTDS